MFGRNSTKTIRSVVAPISHYFLVLVSIFLHALALSSASEGFE